jgi:hypothetical protein
MPRPAAVPFVIRRVQSVVAALSVTETREDSHGLLRLEPGRLVAQWSTARATTHVGMEVRTDRTLGPVHEVALPLWALAGARVRWRLLAWPPRRQLVLRAADLRAFEALAGEAGLLLEHPAELVLDLRGGDRATAREFVADLELALAEAALEEAEASDRLPGADSAGPALPGAGG